YQRSCVASRHASFHPHKSKNECSGFLSARVVHCAPGIPVHWLNPAYRCRKSQTCLEHQSVAQAQCAWLRVYKNPYRPYLESDTLFSRGQFFLSLPEWAATRLLLQLI